MKYTANITAPQRHFLPAGFSITDWKSLEPYFQDLLEQKNKFRAGPGKMVKGFQ